ncbi:hypothetical protein DPMN_084584 [Dreissena polymorpha]|uniref:Uncharacterized protein n=1 Tax=Dreissena polymorpha TaxID=45954 RepID=A0A9D3YB20_DREPO|nr:hypothetical protein DPMN_084584 [Dreissena polymorpha]
MGISNISNLKICVKCGINSLVTNYSSQWLVVFRVRVLDQVPYPKGIETQAVILDFVNDTFVNLQLPFHILLLGIAYPVRHCYRRTRQKRDSQYTR